MNTPHSTQTARRFASDFSVHRSLIFVALLIAVGIGCDKAKVSGGGGGTPQPSIRVSTAGVLHEDGNSSTATVPIAVPSTAFGVAGAAIIVTISNNGGTTLTISDVTATGEVTLTPPTKTTLAKNENTTFTLALTGATLGTATGTVTITSNDPQVPISVIDWSGSVTANDPPSLAISGLATGNGPASLSAAVKLGSSIAFTVSATDSTPNDVLALTITRTGGSIPTIAGAGFTTPAPHSASGASPQLLAMAGTAAMIGTLTLQITVADLGGNSVAIELTLTIFDLTITPSFGLYIGHGKVTVSVSGSNLSAGAYATIDGQLLTDPQFIANNAIRGGVPTSGYSTPTAVDVQVIDGANTYTASAAYTYRNAEPLGIGPIASSATHPNLAPQHRLTRDPQSDRLVVAFAYGNGAQEVYIAQSDNGTLWSSPVAVGTGETIADFDLAVRGNLVVVSYRETSFGINRVGVSVSTNGGVSFTNHLVETQSAVFSRVAILPTANPNPRILTAYEREGQFPGTIVVAHSDDLGVTWTKTDIGRGTSVAIAANPAGGGQVILAYGDNTVVATMELYACSSTNGGESFSAATQISAGGAFIPNGSGASFSPTTGDGFVTGIDLSTNHLHIGRTSTIANFGTWATAIAGVQSAMSFGCSVSATDDGQLAVGVWGNGNQDAGIFRSADRGLTWSPCFVDVTVAQTFRSEVVFGGNNRLYFSRTRHLGGGEFEISIFAGW